MRKLVGFLIVLGILYWVYTRHLVPMLPADPIGEFWRSLKDYISGFVGPTSLGSILPL